MVSEQQNEEEEKEKETLHQINIYDTVSDVYVDGAALDKRAVLESPYHDIAYINGAPIGLVDPRAPDYEDLYQYRGEAISPDTLLDAMKPLALKTPIKYRNEFKDPLPLSDLLKSIVYYFSQLQVPTDSMDESSLLQLGMLVEQWADELIDEKTVRMFLEPIAPPTSEALNPSADLYSRDRKMSEDEAQESDIMSIDMEESTTEEELGLQTESEGSLASEPESETEATKRSGPHEDLLSVSPEPVSRRSKRRVRLSSDSEQEETLSGSSSGWDGDGQDSDDDDNIELPERRMSVEEQSDSNDDNDF